MRPCDLLLAAAALRGSGVAVCTVIGFPLGSQTPATKLAEALEALEQPDSARSYTTHTRHIKISGEQRHDKAQR